jgi:dTDP-glucose 4,6-dehydratase
LPTNRLPTWLVTGGAGFIGANFVLQQRRLARARIINLDKLTYAGNLGSLRDLEGDDGHTFVRADIADQARVCELLAGQRPQAVINFAAESHVDRSILGPQAFLQTNVMGTFALLHAVQGYWMGLPEAERASFRFLHVSTDEVYGTLGPEDPPFSEESAYAPNSPYAASKAAADHLVRAWHRTYGLPTLTTNCSNNYGPYQFPEKLIPLITLSAIEGRSLPVYGDGRQVRDWVYVQDHCDAIAVVLERGHPGETYNIGGNAEMTNLEVVRTVCTLLDDLLPDSLHRPHADLIQHVADRPGHDRRYAIDASKIRTALRWRPRETFPSGIAKTVRWYLEQRRWLDDVRSGDYRDWLETNYGHRHAKDQ